MFTSMHLMKQRRFAPLFATQLLNAFNDNLYKNAMVLFVVYSVYNSETAETVFSGAVSKLGQFLDTIADKIMVVSVILVLAAMGVLRGPYVGDAHVIAGMIIVIREIAVSGLREFLGPLQVSVPVSKLAKWKTTFQLIALGALILGQGLPGWLVDAGTITINLPHTVGLTTLWAAAVLTVITGWDYLRVGLKHMD